MNPATNKKETGNILTNQKEDTKMEIAFQKKTQTSIAFRKDAEVNISHQEEVNWKITCPLTELVGMVIKHVVDITSPLAKRTLCTLVPICKKVLRYFRRGIFTKH